MSRVLNGDMMAIFMTYLLSKGASVAVNTLGVNAAAIQCEIGNAETSSDDYRVHVRAYLEMLEYSPVDDIHE
jgi:hypothetical protein